MRARPETVVVTGAANGIGRAIAREYLGAGANVVAVDLEEATVDESAGDGVGRRWLPVRADTADADAVATVFAHAADRWGAVDVLVCSAAIGYPEPFEQISASSWDRVLAVNLRGPMLCSQAAVRVMREQGSGSIVLISSIAGRRYSVTNGAHYTCSKYALIGLTRHLAAEVAGTGIRVNCVCPGPTETRALEANSDEQERRDIAARTPLRRLGQPDDVAGPVRFLTSDAARHIHGAVLDVNGALY